MHGYKGFKVRNEPGVPALRDRRTRQREARRCMIAVTSPVICGSILAAHGGRHQTTLHKTPRLQNHFRQKVAWMIHQCSTQRKDGS